MTLLSPVDRAYEALAKRENRLPYGASNVGTIQKMARTIRRRFIDAGVVIDEELRMRIVTLEKRLHESSIQILAVNLENPRYSSHDIERLKAHIQKHYDALGINQDPDGPAAQNLKEMARRSHKLSAEVKLAGLEDPRHLLDGDGAIRGIVKEIRHQFRQAGVVVDQSLDHRIKTASANFHNAYALRKLTQLENFSGSIDDLEATRVARQILGHFKSAQMETTGNSVLPEEIKMRVGIAVLNALWIPEL